MIEDLNVRGATAFVHLVQASDEFTEAVEATANAGGELDEMVKIQNESMMAQIQILRNNIGMMFLYRDANYEGTGFLNAFHEAIVTTIQSLQNLVVVEKDGAYELTQFGLALQTIAITGVNEMHKILNNIVPIFERFVEISAFSIKVLKVYLIPLQMIIKALDIMGPTLTKAVLSFHLLSKILPITTIAQWAYFMATVSSTKATSANIARTMQSTITSRGYTAALMTKLMWERLTTAATMLSTKGLIHYTAALGYHQVAALLGITIKQAYVKAETRQLLIDRLVKMGLIENTAATWGMTQSQIMQMAVGNMTLKQKAQVIIMSMKENIAKWAGVTVDQVGIGLMLKRLVYYPIEYMWKLRTYIVDKLKLALDWLLVDVTGIKTLYNKAALSSEMSRLSVKRWTNAEAKTTLAFMWKDIKAQIISTATKLYDNTVSMIKLAWDKLSNAVKIITVGIIWGETAAQEVNSAAKNKSWMITSALFIVEKAAAIWKFAWTIPGILASTAATVLGNLAEGISNMVRTVGLTVMQAENAGKMRKIAITIAATAWLLGEVIVVGLYNIIMGISTIITWVDDHFSMGYGGSCYSCYLAVCFDWFSCFIVVGTFVALYRIIDETIDLL